MTTEGPLTLIAIADDHVLFRKGVIELIEGFGGYSVALEAANGEELVRQLESATEEISIAILDINMPVLDGFDTCSLIKSKFPEVKILALSMYADEISIIRMVKAGADGYVLKDAHPREFEKALSQLIGNGIYYSDHVSSVMVKHLRSNTIDTLEELNEREITFLKLACTEFTYKEIADKMNVSPRTVDGYREALFSKLGVKSRVGLAMLAVKMGIDK